MADVNRKVGQIITVPITLTLLNIAQLEASFLLITAYYGKETWEFEAKWTNFDLNNVQTLHISRFFQKYFDIFFEKNSSECSSAKGIHCCYQFCKPTSLENEIATVSTYYTVVSV